MGFLAHVEDVLRNLAVGQNRSASGVDDLGIETTFARDAGLDVLAMLPKASVVSSLRGCSGAPGLWLFCFPPLRTSHSAHSRYPLPPIGPFVSFGPRVKS
jgi:hypothetical protein